MYSILLVWAIQISLQDSLISFNVFYYSGTLSFYCRQHPHALLGHPDSCAKYYDCSKPGMTLQAKTEECLYPDLFSTVTGKCENFTTVQCDSRKEPQEPCKQNHLSTLLFRLSVGMS